MSNFEIPRTQSQVPTTEDYTKQMEYTQSTSPSEEKSKSTRRTISHLYSMIHFKVLKQGEGGIYAQIATTDSQWENKVLIKAPKNGGIENITKINGCYVGRVHSVTSFNSYNNSIETSIWLQELPTEGRLF